ncbi:MAG: L-threonate dehydrogenase [Pseudomonadota bacterium]
MKIGVVGLGSMGYGMAMSCLRAGHEVYGFDLSDLAVSKFVDAGGLAGDIAACAPELDALVVVVLNAAQLEAVLFGEEGDASNGGAAASMATGAVILACATVPPDVARRMEARAKASGRHYLDAPISGGSVKAEAGQLGVMASGRPAAFDAARPVLDACAETVFELGDEAGAGSAMKAVNQLLAGVHIAAMAEALTFGMTQGIKPEAFFDVISRCAGSSWMLENRTPHIIAGDYTPHSQVNIWPKDLGIVLAAASRADFEAPLTETTLAQFRRAQEMGLGQEDDAAVAKVYAKQAGLALPGGAS